MTPARWRQIEELYQAVRDRPEERQKILAEATPELRAEAERLLAQDAPGKLLDGSTDDLLDELAPPEPASGEALGPYRIESKLAEGGMGKVFRATDTRLHREVAIKIAAAEFDRRFEREARASAALNHPNICTLHDIGPNYLVMELVEGETLAARLKRGPLPMDLVFRYGAQIADALALAHSKGIVHRDLKPSNIMLARTGAASPGVKVLDFGLATALASEQDSISVSGGVLGTPAYMAPEQRDGHEVDARADIYSLGLVLYEMAAGRRFPRDHPREAGELAPLFTHVVEKCVEPEPSARWQSAADVKLALELAAANPALPIQPKRSVLWRWGPLAAAVVLLAGGVLFWWERATHPITDGAPFLQLRVDLGPDATGAARSRSAIAMSPDGTRIAYPVRAGEQTLLAVRQLNGGKEQVLAGTAGAGDPFFSHDGQWIGFFADRKLKKIPTLGGAVIALCPAPASRGATWSESGEIVYTPVNGKDVGLMRVPESGGECSTLTTPKNGEVLHRWPQALPGGDAVLFTSHTSTGAGFDLASIAVLSRRSGAIKTLVRGASFGRYIAGSGASGYLLYVHDDVLYGGAFNLDRLEFLGDAVPLANNVAWSSSTGAAQFDVSRNGTLVYLSAKPRRETWPIAWMDRSGAPKTLSTPPGAYSNLTLAPDGNRLALLLASAKGQDLNVYDIQRGSMTRLTFDGKSRQPQWAPGGRILYRGADGIYWIRADGVGGPERLYAGERAGLVFMPKDGKSLVVAETAPPGGLQWIALDMTGPDRSKPANPRPVLQSVPGDASFALSPDGRWLAYARRETERWQVYVRPFSSSPGTWQISTDDGTTPVWSYDGSELFFSSVGTADLEGRILSSRVVANGETFSHSAPKAWANTTVYLPTPLRSFAPAPDGTQLLVFPAAPAPEELQGNLHATFLLNFPNEIARRQHHGAP
jgi:serine/threonine-protein kinase